VLSRFHAEAMLCSGSAGFDGVATSGLLAILAIASASAIMGPP
jgi:hypothetical protein